MRQSPSGARLWAHTLGSVPGRMGDDVLSLKIRMTVARVFTREEFYELVWSKPMTHLAKEFAISDVALHKISQKARHSQSATRLVGEKGSREEGEADTSAAGQIRHR